MSLDRAGATALPEQTIGGLRPRRTAWQQVGAFFRHKPLGAFGAVVFLILLFVAIFTQFGGFAIEDPYDPVVERIFDPPSREAWFGGDHIGRDVFSRVVHGSWISLYVGILSSFIGSTIGMMVGVASVHFGGKTDLIVQRVVDSMMAFPALILAIAIMAALGGSLNNVVIALSIVYIPSTARVLRSQALGIKEMDYILAARAVGAGDWRVMLLHMIPNCLAVYIVIVTFHLGRSDHRGGLAQFSGSRSTTERTILGWYVDGWSPEHKAIALGSRIPWRRHSHSCVRLEPTGRFAPGRAGPALEGNNLRNAGLP